MFCCSANTASTKNESRKTTQPFNINSVRTNYSPPNMQYTAISEIAPLVQSARATATAQTLFPIKTRKEVLKNLIDFITVNEQKIFDVLKSDLGRHPHESYVVEVSQILGELQLAHDNVETWAKPSKVGTGMNTLHMLDGLSIKPEPLGLVCIIAPWNYPLSMCFAPLAGAIAAGNVVVMKPSELSEATSSFIAAEIPKFKNLGNFIHIVNGGKDETTELLKHKFDHIFYTGNGMVGRIVMAAAAQHLTPVTLELGGKSPVIVHESCKAHLEYAARRIMWGKFVNCGQTCVGPDYVLVHASVEKPFLEALKTARDEFFGLGSSSGGGSSGAKKGSSSVAPSTTTEAALTETLKANDCYGRIINERHWKRIMNLIPLPATNNAAATEAKNEEKTNNEEEEEEEEKEGERKEESSSSAMAPSSSSSEIFFGGQHDESSRFLAPTVLTKVNVETAPVMKEEIFGPLLPVIPYSTADEAIAFVNNRDKPLALYVFSQNNSFIDSVLSRTSSGGVTINDVMMHVGSTFIPFGGVGESGMGRYHGKFSFDTFSHQRSILHKSLNGLGETINGKSRYPPYTEGMTKLVRKLV